MIHLTREVRFSVDRDWAGRVASSRPVTNSWSGWPSAVGLVPYLRFRVTVRGEPDPQTGYLCNIKLLDQLIREHAIPPIADRLHARGWRLAAEAVVRLAWDSIQPTIPQQATLARLELLATPYLSFAVVEEAPHMVQLTQQFEFSAAHRLHCPERSAAQNRDYFGKCNNPNGHGHNYVVEITVNGAPEAASGALLSLPKFETLVRDEVIDRLDHKHLNEDTTEFRAVNPTVENIARVVWEMLHDKVSQAGVAKLSNVRVYETPKTWADYAG